MGYIETDIKKYTEEKILITLLKKIINIIQYKLFKKISPKVMLTGFFIDEDNEKKYVLNFSVNYVNKTNSSMSISNIFLKLSTKRNITPTENNLTSITTDEHKIIYRIDSIIKLAPKETYSIKEFFPFDDSFEITSVSLVYSVNNQTYEKNLPIPADRLVEIKMNNAIMNTADFLAKKISKNEKTITLTATFVTTFFIALVNYMSYVIEFGKVSALKINHSAISLVHENVLYHLILSAMFGLFYLLLSFALLVIIKSQRSITKKIFIHLIAFIILSVIIFLLSGFTIESLKETDYIIKISSFILIFLLYIILLMPSYILNHVFEKKRNREPKNNTSKKTRIIHIMESILSFVIAITIGAFVFGASIASTSSKYRIISNEYAIIYETKDQFYLAKYDITEKSINLNEQKIVSKDNVTYTWTDGIHIKE